MNFSKLIWLVIIIQMIYLSVCVFADKDALALFLLISIIALLIVDYKINKNDNRNNRR